MPKFTKLLSSRIKIQAKGIWLHSQHSSKASKEMPCTSAHVLYSSLKGKLERYISNLCLWEGIWRERERVKMGRTQGIFTWSAMFKYSIKFYIAVLEFSVITMLYILFYMKHIGSKNENNVNVLYSGHVSVPYFFCNCLYV